MEDKRKGTTIIFGAPLSGKTTYVLKRKRKDEVMVDMDYLFQAITGNDMYNKPEPLVKLVLSVRDHIYGFIKKNPMVNKYWIITTESDTQKRRQLIRKFDADSIVIKPDKEICVQRVKESDRVEQNWKELINKWYENFESIKGDRLITNG